MSLLVRYTLKDPAGHDAQARAMAALVAGLKSENVPVQYSCFATEDPAEFIGLLEFADDAAFQAFQASAAFATYRDTVGPTFANPPKTTRLTHVAATRP